MMIDDGRGAGFSLGPVSSFRWRTGAQDKGLSLDEAVSDYLRVPKREAADLIDFGSVYVRGLIERNPSRDALGGRGNFRHLSSLRNSQVLRNRSNPGYFPRPLSLRIRQGTRYSEPTNALRRLQQCFCGPASPSGKGENL